MILQDEKDGLKACDLLDTVELVSSQLTRKTRDIVEPFYHVARDVPEQSGQTGESTVSVAPTF